MPCQLEYDKPLRPAKSAMRAARRRDKLNIRQRARQRFNGGITPADKLPPVTAGVYHSWVSTKY